VSDVISICGLFVGFRLAQHICDKITSERCFHFNWSTYYQLSVTFFTYLANSVFSCDLAFKGQWCYVVGKVTVGRVSQWPCITDSVVYPPVACATVIEREISTQPMPLLGYGTFTCTFTVVMCVVGICVCLWLCSLVVCGSASDLREMSSWDGKGPASRCKLIHQLQGENSWSSLIILHILTPLVCLFVCLSGLFICLFATRVWNSLSTFVTLVPWSSSFDYISRLFFSPFLTPAASTFCMCSYVQCPCSDTFCFGRFDHSCYSLTYYLLVCVSGC